jgi:DNA-binding NarL/FixJ family response regulator
VKAMNASPRSVADRRLRVLLIGNPGAASVALSTWLGERELDLAGPATTTVAAVVLAASFKPDVILLDFHGLPVSIAYTVSLLKELSPAPLVLVLTHDASAAMRRRCLAAGVDAVFDKTTQLEEVAAVLEQTRQSIDRPVAGPLVFRPSRATPSHDSLATAPR